MRRRRRRRVGVKVVEIVIVVIVIVLVGFGAFQVGVFDVCVFLGEEELVVRMGNVEGDGGCRRGGAAAAAAAAAGGVVFDQGNGNGRDGVVESGVLDGHDGHSR